MNVESIVDTIEESSSESEKVDAHSINLNEPDEENTSPLMYAMISKKNYYLQMLNLQESHIVQVKQILKER